MKPSLLGAALGLAALASLSPALAQVSAFSDIPPAEKAVVVELYTSQGCSSCPPADEFLQGLAVNPSVIPLALHVDYWDYIGWADSFANPRFTDRQKAYARAEGTRTIYTPQMVIGGVGSVVGVDADAIAHLIRQELAHESPVTLWAWREGEMLVVRAELARASSVPMFVQVVRYKPEETVEIRRGENAGRTVTYTNIVTQWSKVGSWTGDKPLDIAVTASGKDATVVIIQTEGPGRILAAARVE